MFTIRPNRTRKGQRFLALLVLLSLGLGLPVSVFGGKKKKADAAPPKGPPVIDYSNIVWPNPPAIARIKYQAFYAAEKISQVDTPKTTKQNWMDRLAGTQPASENTKVLFQLAEPYGMAVDSKNNLYVDQPAKSFLVSETAIHELTDARILRMRHHQDQE
jgi:hypothetical protein